MPHADRPFSDDRESDSNRDANADRASDSNPGSDAWRKARMGASGRFSPPRLSNYVGLGTAALVFGGAVSLGPPITNF